MSTAAVIVTILGLSLTSAGGFLSSNHWSTDAKLRNAARARRNKQPNLTRLETLALHPNYLPVTWTFTLGGAAVALTAAIIGS